MFYNFDVNLSYFDVGLRLNCEFFIAMLFFGARARNYMVDSCEGWVEKPILCKSTTTREVSHVRLEIGN